MLGERRYVADYAVAEPFEGLSKSAARLAGARSAADHGIPRTVGVASRGLDLAVTEKLANHGRAFTQGKSPGGAPVSGIMFVSDTTFLRWYHRQLRVQAHVARAQRCDSPGEIHCCVSKGAVSPTRLDYPWLRSDWTATAPASLTLRQITH